MGIWKHIKTGNLYRVIWHATDCTNSRDGTPVVIYDRVGELGDVYVRDAAEFAAKFEKVQDYPTRED